MLLSNVLASKDFIEKGRLLSDSGILLFPGFEQHSKFTWDDWTENPFSNRSWQWRLNWLSFLSFLIAHHASSGIDAALDKGRDSIQSWLDKYLLTDENCGFEFIWHDHGTALRAEQIHLFLTYVSQYASGWKNKNLNFFQYAQKACRIHAAWLVKDSFYSIHTNHGLEQSRVLLLLSFAFSEDPQATHWRRLAIGRLESELDYSFTEEGVHVENSPAYHVFVFKVFTGVLEDYSSEALGDLSLKFKVFSKKALEFTARIIRPDGFLPIIGDTEQLPTTDSYRASLGDSLEYSGFCFANSQGRRGVKFSSLNKVYAKSGYAIFRDGWQDSGKNSRSLHLIVKAGCLSNYHHQQDEGHVSLYALGEDWLIDSGLYNYNQTDLIRKYMRSRQAHNVAVISNSSYPAEFKKRLSGWNISNFDESDNFPFVEIDIRVLEQIRQIRRVSLNNEKSMVTVDDDFLMQDGVARDVTLLWHVPLDKVIKIVGDGSVKIFGKTGISLSLNVMGDRPDEVLVRKGVTGSQVFSCISLKSNKYQDSQVIQVVFKARKVLKIACAFSF